MTALRRRLGQQGLHLGTGDTLSPATLVERGGNPRQPPLFQQTVDEGPRYAEGPGRFSYGDVLGFHHYQVYHKPDSLCIVDIDR